MHDGLVLSALRGPAGRQGGCPEHRRTELWRRMQTEQGFCGKTGSRPAGLSFVQKLFPTRQNINRMTRIFVSSKSLVKPRNLLLNNQIVP